MKKLVAQSGLALSLLLSAGANAAIIGAVDLSGDFSLTGFADENPLSYTLEGLDLVGSATSYVPPGSQADNITASGSFNADAGSNSLLPEIVFNNLPFAADGITGTSPLSYNFTNGKHTNTSGNFDLFIESIPGSVAGSPADIQLNTNLNVQYDIFAQQADNVLNDIRISFIETPTALPTAANPFTSLSAIVNVLDGLSTSGQPGTIDGTFSTDIALNGDLSSASVSEPATLALLGLGLAGFFAGRRTKS